LDYHTNRYRKEDGELAGPNLIEWLKKEKRYKKIPVLLFCGNTSAVSHIHQPKKFVFVSDDASEAVNFGSFASSDSDKCLIG